MFHQNQLASTASLSQLLRNDIQLLDSSFESSSSLQLSAPSSEKNDIQKQTTTTYWDSPEAVVSKWYRNFRKHRKFQLMDLLACQPQHLHEHCFNDMAKKTWIPFPSKCFRNIYMTRSYQHWSIRHSMNLLRKKRSRVLVLHLTWTLRSTSQS